MDRFEGRARLEWWANHAPCLEEYDIDITATVDAVGKWRATGRHATALEAPQREGWNCSGTAGPTKPAATRTGHSFSKKALELRWRYLVYRYRRQVG
ncbi:hypothetical protein [Streptomyces sp. NPDC055886]